MNPSNSLTTPLDKGGYQRNQGAAANRCSNNGMIMNRKVNTRSNPSKTHRERKQLPDQGFTVHAQHSLCFLVSAVFGFNFSQCKDAFCRTWYHVIVCRKIIGGWQRPTMMAHHLLLNNNSAFFFISRCFSFYWFRYLLPSLLRAYHHRHAENHALTLLGGSV